MDDASSTHHSNANPNSNTSAHTNVGTNANNSPNAGTAAKAPRQGRSRTTVVCGECKRLKLRCDQRHPCASCTKRRTVERCIYAPGAAEKVDVASLNNRLIPVEALLTLLTAGQFQSTYPLANPAVALPVGFSFDPASFSALLNSLLTSSGFNPSTPEAATSSATQHDARKHSQHHSYTHNHHNHQASLRLHEPRHTIFLSAHDLALALLEELDLDMDSDPGTAFTTDTTTDTNMTIMDTTPTTTNSNTNTNYIKLELDPSSSTHHTSSSFVSSPSTAYQPLHEFDFRSSTLRPNTHLLLPTRTKSQAQRQRRRQAQAHHLLPALSIYYPSSIGSASGLASTPLATSASSAFDDLASPLPPSSTATPTTTSTSNQYTFPPQVRLSPYPQPPPAPAFSSSSTSVHLLSGPSQIGQTTAPRTPRPSTSTSTSTNPQITPALLSLLPPRGVCKIWLGRARVLLEARIGVLLAFSLSGGRRSGGTERGGKGKATEGKKKEDAWRSFESRCLRALSTTSGFGHSFSSPSPSLTSAPPYLHAHPPTHERKRTYKPNGDKERDKKERERREKTERERREKEKARMIYLKGMPGLQTSTSIPLSALERGEGGRRSGSSASASGSGSTSTSGRRRERDRRSERRDPAHGADPGDPGDEPGQQEQEHEPESLPFFALLCFVLAVGASSPASPSSPLESGNEPHTHTPGFLFELGRQALGVWDTCCPSFSSFSSSSSAGGLGKERMEREREEYVLACVVGVVYLVRAGTIQRPSFGVEDADDDDEMDRGEAGDADAEGQVIALVGKMINAARSLGLDRLSSPFSSLLSESESRSKGKGKGKGKHPMKEDGEREEWKKMLWWEVLFWDLFTADAQHRAPLVPLDAYLSNSLPFCAGLQLSSTSEAQDDDEGDEDEDEGNEGEADDEHDEENEVEDERRYKPVLRLDEQAQAGGEERDEEADGGLDMEKAYAGARYRLTHLTALIKDRVARPSCSCCGYTLEEALALEGEVGRFGAGLPPSLRLSPTSSSAELAMMAGLLVLMVYKPFLLRGRGGKDASVPGSAPVPAPGPAQEACVRAARGVLRAAKELKSLSSSSSSSSPSVFLDLYPLDETLLDASVICAHAALHPRPSSLSSFGYANTNAGDGKERVVLVEVVRSALDLISGPNTSLTGRQRWVVEGLRERLVRSVGEGAGAGGGVGAGASGKKSGGASKGKKAGEVTPTHTGLKRRREDDDDEGTGGGTGSGGRGFGGAFFQVRPCGESADGGRIVGSVNLNPNPGTTSTLSSTSTSVSTTSPSPTVMATEYHLSNNGAAGAGGGEGMVSGYDFGGSSGNPTTSQSLYNPFPTQYAALQLPPPLPQPDQVGLHGVHNSQQHHSGMVDMSSSQTQEYVYSDQYQGLSSPSAYTQQRELHQQGSAGMPHVQGSTSVPASMPSPSTSTSVADPHMRLADLGRNSGSGGGLSGPRSAGARAGGQVEKMEDDAERQRERARDKDRERGDSNSKQKDKDKDKVKDKKHAKTQRTYPAVGIRVRDRASNPLLKSRQPDAVTGRSMTTADTVRAYQEQQKKLAAAAAGDRSMSGQGQGQSSAPPAQVPSPAAAAYRSRSSSSSMAQTKQIDQQFPFSQAKAQSKFSVRQQQPQHSQPPSFGPHPHSQMFEHSPFSQQHQQSPLQQSPLQQSPLQQSPLQQLSLQHPHPHPHSQSMFTDTMAYNPVSSPFSNASSSPFVSTSSGPHPLTPTFGSQHQHQPTPPFFGPPPPPPPPPLQTNSPAMHFHPHTPSAYGSSCGGSPASSGPHSQMHGHGQGMQLDNMSLDHAMLSVPSTPVYEVKPGLESWQRRHLSQSQHHQQGQMLQQYHHDSVGPQYDQEMSLPAQPYQQQQYQIESGMAISSPWSAQPHQHQHQQQQPSTESQPFWNPGGDFKFN
ncbi:unnamed protein product [Cyclocybe aegerita]|uniref:Zn(2)-C6 fungal-type domain-containing protein n=1 Tax=Cyclocybe aegerita TaxID=1973307 RepID=A0A8S0WAM1_CYCAE|nr:unnamed protein product [Cyclocybe aegerita]